MTFTKKHNPGCGCCECEGVPTELYYRIPEGEEDYVRTKYGNYYGIKSFTDYETYNSTWNELSGTWTKRYYQTVEDATYPRTPDFPHGLMTEDDDAILIYKPLDQNHQRSVVTVHPPWVNDYTPTSYPQYSSTQFCDFEMVLICAYQDANNYLFAKLRIRRRTELALFSSDPEEKKGNDKYSEIEFYERSAGTDTKIGETRFWYTDEGPDGSYSKIINAGFPMVLEWCYTPETYDNDGKMAVTIYAARRHDSGRQENLYGSGTNLFSFKDGFYDLHVFQGNTQQGHWSFTQEMNGTGTQVGFGTGTIHVAPGDTELTARRSADWIHLEHTNKGLVFEKFGNYLHNKENGACPKCQEGCVPHTTGVGIRQEWSHGQANLKRSRNAKYIYKYQYEKIPSTNDDLNFVSDGQNDYAVITANNADTKWISYHEVKHAKNHNYSLRFFLAFDEDDDDLTDNDYEISLVFDYKDDNNYHRLKFTATLVFATGSSFDVFEQTDVTLQLYKVTGGSESAVGDAITATLNHQYIHLVVCTLTDQVQIGLGEADHEWQRFSDSDGILHTEMIATTLHDGKRFGFATGSTVDDDNQIQSPVFAVMERRKYCRECSKTICEGCGNAPAFYKVIIEFGRQVASWDWWLGQWRVHRFDTNIPDGCDRYSCQVTNGTYLATKTSDCVYEFENDNVKFWLKLNRARWSNTLNADVQVWRKYFVDNPDNEKAAIASEPNVEGLTAPWTEDGTYVADCGLPHEFTIYTSEFGWWNNHQTCHISCPAPFQSHPFGYRIRIVRE